MKPRQPGRDSSQVPMPAEEILDDERTAPKTMTGLSACIRKARFFIGMNQMDLHSPISHIGPEVRQ